MRSKKQIRRHELLKKNTSKIFPFHALKAYIVDVWLHSDAGEWLTPRPGRFTLRKRTPIPMEYDAGRSPEPIGTFRRREKSLASTRIRTPDRPARSLVTKTTKLLRLTNYKKRSQWRIANGNSKEGMQKETKQEFWVKLRAKSSVVQIFNYTDSLKIIVIVLFISFLFFLFCERLMVQIVWTSNLSDITWKFRVITMFLILELLSVSSSQCVCVRARVCTFLYGMSPNQASLAYLQWLIAYHIQIRSWTEFHSLTILLLYILPKYYFDKTFTLVLDVTISYRFSALK